jgi:hypothetical protein
MSETGIKPYYERRAPSPQNVADLFGGSWKAMLPGGVASGTVPLFDDLRPAWAASVIPGGLQGKTVLELGPLEAYTTYRLLREGARSVLSVEANSINFLKCLCVKEICNLHAAQFLFGDAVEYVRDCDERFDVAWASGILYHLQDPILFVECIARLAPVIYIWTHYFDTDVMRSLRNGQERHFLPEVNIARRCPGRDIVLHARSYLLPQYESNVPMNWEGGPEQFTYWLTKADIFWLFELAGMRIASIEFDNTNVNGLPALGFLALKT